MRKLFRKGAWYHFSIICYVFFSSCGTPNHTGSDILPEDDFIGAFYVDTIISETKPVLIDTVRTSNIGQIMFGVCKDPEFGKVTADGYLQFSVTGSSVDFGDRTKLGIDSLVLSIDLNGVYGRYDHVQRLQIEELDAPGFERDSVYYSNREFPVKGPELSNDYSMDFNPFSGYFDIRVPLDTNLGNKLLFASTDTLNDNALFQSLFNGIRIKTQGYSGFSREQGAVFYIDAAPGGNTKLTLYFHEDTTHTSYDFKISDNCAKFTHITRADSETTLLGYAIADPAGIGSTYSFIQDGALIKTFIRFPGLSDLPKCVIHKALLILSVDPSFLGSRNRFDPPTEYYAYLCDSTGKQEDISLEAFPTTYSPSTQKVGFDLTKPVMQIVTGNKPNYGFLLVPALGGVFGRTMSRTVFGGPSHPTLKPVLKIIYSSLPGQ